MKWSAYFDSFTVDEFKSEFTTGADKLSSIIEAFDKEGRYVQQVLVAKTSTFERLQNQGWGVLLDFGDGTAGFVTQSGDGLFTVPFNTVKSFMNSM